MRFWIEACECPLIHLVHEGEAADYCLHLTVADALVLRQMLDEAVLAKMRIPPPWIVAGQPRPVGTA